MTVRRDETMRPRLIVALIALAGLTAFAPAPLPRTARRADHAVVEPDTRLTPFKAKYRVGVGHQARVGESKLSGHWRRRSWVVKPD